MLQWNRLTPFYIPMSLDLDSFDDDDLDEWCNDVGNCGMPPPRLRPLCESVGRSLDEIMELEVQIIQECTDIDAITWVQLYASKYRAIMEEDSSGTKSQIKRKLYIND